MESETTSCEVDLTTRTLECVVSRDPVPDAADDESRTTLTVGLGEGAFDGTTRGIDGITDHVLTELSFAGEMYDASSTEGLVAGATHDAAVDTVVVWHRRHLISEDEYDRVEVTGEVTIDAEGHGRVDVAWTAPSSISGGGAGSIDATF